MRILIIILSLLLFTSCSFFIENTYTMPGGDHLEPGDKVTLEFQKIRDVRIDGKRLSEMNVVKENVKLDNSMVNRPEFTAKVIVTPGRHNIYVTNGYGRKTNEFAKYGAETWWPCHGQGIVEYKGGSNYVYKLDPVNIRYSSNKTGETELGLPGCKLICKDCAKKAGGDGDEYGGGY